MHRTCAGLCHAERGNQGDYRQKLAQSGKVSTEVRQPMSNRRHTVLVSDSPIANGMKLLEPHLLMMGDQA